MAGRLASNQLSHEKILAMGYAVTRDADGRVIVSGQEIVSGDALTLEFHDGKIAVVARGAPRPPAHPAEPKAPARAKKPSPPGQGSLL
jgi:exodeoxyribonuclease VII large subunit